jgi:CRISPR-associated protein Csx16
MSEKKIVLISFLGTGRYEKVGYKWGEDTIDLRTEFVPLALCKFLQKKNHIIENVVILATEQAELAHGEELRQALQENNLKYDFVPYPFGNNTDEIWKQFNILADQIEFEKKCSEAEVVLDITHGFRSMPFFAAAATVFVSMVRKKKPLHIFYGAFQSNWEFKKPPPAEDKGGISEIWELGDFTELIDWSHALNMFLHTGNVGDLTEKTKIIASKARKKWYMEGQKGEAPGLNNLSGALGRFGESLATVRTGDLLLGPADNKNSAARALLEQVQILRPQIKNYMPPMAYCLDKIEEMVKPLQTETLSGKKGMMAISALAGLYHELGRYAECASTLREGMVNLFATPEKTDSLLPGRLELNGRAEVESLFMGFQQAEKKSSVSTLAGLRNDIEHAGYRANPSTPQSIKDGLRKLISSFADGNTLLEIEKYFSDKAEFFKNFSESVRNKSECVFVNISNHPLSNWSEKQKEAALHFAGNIAELPFLSIHPEMGTEEIEKIADDFLKKLPENTTHAMVMGEFVLTHILVKKLQRQGIVCLAATTERRTTENAGVKTSVFDFVTFRPYSA